MEQLAFPFSPVRTLPFRVITSVGLPNPLCLTLHRQLEFDFKHKTKPKGSRHKKRFFNNKKFVPCCYCDTLLSFDEATVEHIVPISKGGSNRKNNVTIACGPCNNHRQDYSFEQWKNLVKISFARTRKGTIPSYASVYDLMFYCLKTRGRLIERRYLK